MFAPNTHTHLRPPSFAVESSRSPLSKPLLKRSGSLPKSATESKSVAFDENVEVRDYETQPFDYSEGILSDASSEMPSSPFSPAFGGALGVMSPMMRPSQMSFGPPLPMTASATLQLKAAAPSAPLPDAPRLLQCPLAKGSPVRGPLMMPHTPPPMPAPGSPQQQPLADVARHSVRSQRSGEPRGLQRRGSGVSYSLMEMHEQARQTPSKEDYTIRQAQDEVARLVELEDRKLASVRANNGTTETISVHDIQKLWRSNSSNENVEPASQWDKTGGFLSPPTPLSPEPQAAPESSSVPTQGGYSQLLDSQFCNASKKKLEEAEDSLKRLQALQKVRFPPLHVSTDPTVLAVWIHPGLVPTHVTEIH